MARESTGSRAKFQLLRLLRLEESQESRVLGEERFDFEDARACPILEPGFAEIVLDLVKAAFTHGLNIGTVAGRRHGPNGSFRVVVSPTNVAVLGPLASHQSSFRQGLAHRRGARRRGAGDRPPDPRTTGGRRP